MGFFFLAGDGADHADEVGLLGVSTVGEVETGDIEAGANKLAEDVDGTAGGAEGGDDLRAAGTQYFNRRGEVRHCIWRGLHVSVCRVLSYRREERMV